MRVAEIEFDPGCLEELTGEQLVAIYNALKPEAPVAKFKDKARGVERVQAALTAAQPTGTAVERKSDRPLRFISLITTDNPKRPGSKAFARYSLYRTGMSVDEAVAAGVSPQDLKHDSQRGYIRITDKPEGDEPAPEAPQ